ncbi:hypothetical protein STVA_34620 [Allostella vacuolata]|nr:hypothetical protein STVA_34620 [Stella vacuolata]
MSGARKGSGGTGPKAPTSKAPGSKAAGGKASSSRAPGSKSTGAKSTGAKSAGAKVASSKTARSKTPGPKSAGAKPAGAKPSSSRAPNPSAPGSTAPGSTVPAFPAPGAKVPAVKGATEKGTSGRGARDPAVRVRALGRTTSQQRWLTRQLNDPYVAAAKRQGLRSRAAFKLMELDDRLHLLKPGMMVVDLGAAPGGWTQVVVERVKGGRVVALDILPMDPIPGAETIEMDFLAEAAPARLREAMGGGADLVLSDMAASATGHGPTDHLRVIGLAEAAHAFAAEVLRPGGGFVCKVFQGGTEGSLLNALKQDFSEVKHVKPPASRADSAEVYVIARGFRREHG